MATDNHNDVMCSRNVKMMMKVPMPERTALEHRQSSSSSSTDQESLLVQSAMSGGVHGPASMSGLTEIGYQVPLQAIQERMESLLSTARRSRRCQMSKKDNPVNCR
jgi:hypothetical protein